MFGNVSQSICGEITQSPCGEFGAKSGAVVITAQPVSQNGAYGATHPAFSCTADHSPSGKMDYRWYLVSGGVPTLVQTATNVSNGVANTYQPDASGRFAWTNDYGLGFRYYCVACDHSDASDSATSNAVGTNITYYAIALSDINSYSWAGTCAYQAGGIGPWIDTWPAVQSQVGGPTSQFDIGKKGFNEPPSHSATRCRGIVTGTDAFSPLDVHLPDKAIKGMDLSGTFSTARASENFTLKGYLYGAYPSAPNPPIPPGLGLLATLPIAADYWAETLTLATDAGGVAVVNANLGILCNVLFTTENEEAAAGADPGYGPDPFESYAHQQGAQLALTYDAI